MSLIVRCFFNVKTGWSLTGKSCSKDFELAKLPPNNWWLLLDQHTEVYVPGWYEPIVCQLP